MKLTYESKETGTFLVCCMEEGETLDATSMGMLDNNRIEGVLPLNYSQMYDARYIKYNISSKVSLNRYFSGVVSRSRMVNVMKSMAFAVLTAEDYMLEASSFLWDKDYIFVDVNTAEAYLIYIPVADAERKVSLDQFFKQLLLGVQFDQTENCDYVAKLLGFFHSNVNFSLKAFYQMLNRLSDEVSGDVCVKPETKGTIRPAGNPSPSVEQQAKEVQDNISGQEVQTRENGTGEMRIPGGSVISAPGAGSSEKDQSNKKPFLGIFGKKEKGTKKAVEEKAGKEVEIKESTKGKKARRQKKEKDQSIHRDGKGVQPGFNIPGQSSMRIPGQNSGDEPENAAVNAVSQVPGHESMAKQWEMANVQVEEGTEVLEDETEVYGDETEVVGVDIGSAWLELLDFIPGLTPRIDLNFDKPYLTIGRISSDEVRPDIAFPRELKRIGRRHARIERRGGEYYITDLGSANHTLLDNEILAANQPYQLRDGMELAFTTGKLVRYLVHIM